MGFLRFGLALLLFVRILSYAQRWRGSAGEPITVGPDSVRAHIIRGKHKDVRGVRLTLDVSDQFRFTLRPENSLDRIAKRFGIAREWQTGDEQFDCNVFILSEDPTLLETLSGDRELRSLIATLLNVHDRGRLECARGKLTFDVSVSDVDRELSDEHLREMFGRELHPALAGVRDRLARISVGDWQHDRDPALRRKAWLVGISTALAAAGLLGTVFLLGYDRYQIVREAIPHYSAWITGGIGAAMVAATLLGLRRTSHTHAVLLDVLVAAMPGAWLASNTGLTWYNEHYDASTPRHILVSVESMYTTKHRSSTNYHLVVSNWPDPRGNDEVDVRREEYAMTHSGGCIGAIWHAGRLGDGWISGYERANTNNCGVMVE